MSAPVTERLQRLYLRPLGKEPSPLFDDEPMGGRVPTIKRYVATDGTVLLPWGSLPTETRKLTAEQQASGRWERALVLVWEGEVLSLAWIRAEQFFAGHVDSKWHPMSLALMARRPTVQDALTTARLGERGKLWIASGRVYTEKH